MVATKLYKNGIQIHFCMKKIKIEPFLIDLTLTGLYNPDAGKDHDGADESEP